MENISPTTVVPEDFHSPMMHHDHAPQDSKAAEIAELSKRGYHLLKDNRIDEANEAFQTILSLEENNNYALVGLGDAERKQNHFREAIKYYTQCLNYHASNN